MKEDHFVPRRLRDQVGDPEVVYAQVADGYQVILFRVHVRFVESEAYHCNPFPGGEGVVQRVAELGVADGYDSLRHLAKHVLNAV